MKEKKSGKKQRPVIKRYNGVLPVEEVLYKVVKKLVARDGGDGV